MRELGGAGTRHVEHLRSAKSELMSVPPGAMSSAARKPVSPGPAASSSTRWPGWGSIASTSQPETGRNAACIRSRCVPQPAAARAQRWRLALRYAAALVVHQRVSVKRTTRLRAGALLPKAPAASEP